MPRHHGGGGPRWRGRHRVEAYPCELRVVDGEGPTARRGSGIDGVRRGSVSSGAGGDVGVTTMTAMAAMGSSPLPGVCRNTQLEVSPGQAKRRHPCGIRNVTRPSRNEMVSPGCSRGAARTRHTDTVGTPTIRTAVTPAMIHPRRKRMV
jgi:hypothetical protein